MSDSGHPSRHGFVQCAWCGCWRRGDAVRASAFVSGEQVCDDRRWCDSKHGATRTETARPATNDAKPGWDANGAPIEQGEAASG